MYMSKLVYPSTQSPEYAFDCIPKVSSTQDMRFWFSVGMYATLVGIGVVGLYRAVYCSVRSNSTVVDSCISSSGESAGGSADRSGETLLSNNADDENEASAVDDSDPPTTQTTTSSTFETTLLTPPQSATPVESSMPSDAVLHSLMLLVVFFLPASGLVFRLGTLLAERLMYTPSIGSCLLVVAAIYFVSTSVATFLCWLFGLDRTSKKSASCESVKKSEVKGTKPSGVPASSAKPCTAYLTQFFFWPCILALAFFYTQRTRTYNKVWKDDNTLFLESLSVCPHSAKMNLQVSKVYSQRGDFTSARRHLEAAQRIDPDFCDTGYQDVVITMAVAASQGKRNSLDIAAEKAVKNLHCIYTNTATITLLNHLWSSQLQSVQATGNKVAISQELEKQGKIALSGDVQFLAAQKFVEASSIAFDAQLVDKSVKLVTKAEKIVLSLEEAHGNATNTEEAVELSAEVRCRIFTLSGLFRTSQLQNRAQKRAADTAKSAKSAKQKKKTDKEAKEQKNIDKLTQRTKDLLHRAVFKDCLQAAVHLPPLEQAGQSVNSVVVEHLPLAINHLVSMWTLQVSLLSLPAYCGCVPKIQVYHFCIVLTFASSSYCFNFQMNSPQQTGKGSADASPTPQALETYAQDLTSVFYIASLLQRRISIAPAGSAAASAPSAQQTKVIELCQVLQKLALNAYHLAGTKYLNQQQLAEAVHSFQRGLLVHSDLHTTSVVNFKYGRTSMDRREHGPMPVVTLQDFRNVSLSAESCTSLHW